MATLEEPTTAPEQQPVTLPDYMTDPNAVLKDSNAEWRYKNPPDYKKTRKYYSESEHERPPAQFNHTLASSHRNLEQIITPISWPEPQKADQPRPLAKSKNHTAGSLPELVENLVKNWEIEASYKTQLSDWRTVDFTQYSFAVNEQEPVSAEHMLRTFKRMMPTFAWEVLEVYTEPPVVAFKWRHWGQFRGDYSAVNAAGESVKVAAHGGLVDITGVTVAHLNEKLQVTKLKTWFDSDEMFRQMDPDGQAARVPLASCPIIGGGDEPATAVKTDLNVA
ncbi:hypothetical protein NUW58_g7609 [Xylaria curta]|uniref:Uncharacterized protein n=1 Tax=Xylaria curta TaxID=42375 RepID=A0ACC1NGQ6_9PEZI|nr:hypothetical protein NUW58_g7609 [Xylaria curta]